ncbi:hypothetical protein GCM10010129_53810 [Streptomyces fumigatiscleroticus]|nr:hypothetical protein GCM10010129_53810 [Streptomyces fumigatiscleroticus]
MRAHGTPAQRAAEQDRARRPAAPGTPVQRVLALQRLAGNAAVARAVEESRHEHDANCGHGPAVQRSAVHEVLRSAGRPLDEPVRTEMEARHGGADFSGVRVHTDAVAQRSAAEIGAKAYTSGSHVVWDGRDKHTLAHELTHVIQQSRGPVAGTDNGAGLRVSDPSDTFEREAEATATRVMAGPVPDLPAPVQRAGGPTSGAAASGTPVQRASTGEDSMDLDEFAPGEFSDAEAVGYDADSDAGEWDQAAYDTERGRYHRDTTDAPQPAAGFGTSTYGLHPSRLKTRRKNKNGQQAPKLKYRKDREPLYRYDTRPPEVILREGFKPWNDKMPRSLRLYQKTLDRTALVSTSRSHGGYTPEWAKQPDGSAYLYVVNPPGGIDLVDSLGTSSFAQQQEVVFWKGIRPEFIVRVEKYDKDGKLVASATLNDLIRHEAAAAAQAQGRPPTPMDMD